MARNKRIKFLSELTQGYDCVLDIGTDHGLVLLEAFKNGYIKSAIASDLREEPLKSAKKSLNHYPVEFVISDGFKNIQSDFDLGIIAGMGAYLIKDILKYAPMDKTYILQANDNHEILREFLAKQGFEIVDEHIIHDKFYYVIMIIKKGHMKLSEADLYLGPKLKYKKEAKPFYDQKIKQFQKIYPKADDARQQALSKLIKIYQME
ncbi:tRNA (adenine(22)-N(1))-methyltransferase [Mariniplasma anaerobium]|uniref:SAM-dependent methyltransferase n=1 Tax=Mariniplasma anaerobium TaxID=2735436 RepID=A0A7U9XW95_9MOLU|nr:class I SAM-dependent methyltransferase [Mariniplasma anaerobium]BCR35546.1 SAM-dependent methyltransferase [Mariniplasma anaerobium]